MYQFNYLKYTGEDLPKQMTPVVERSISKEPLTLYEAKFPFLNENRYSTYLHKAITENNDEVITANIDYNFGLNFLKTSVLWIDGTVYYQPFEDILLKITSLFVNSKDILANTALIDDLKRYYMRQIKYLSRKTYAQLLNIENLRIKHFTIKDQYDNYFPSVGLEPSYGNFALRSKIKKAQLAKVYKAKSFNDLLQTIPNTLINHLHEWPNSNEASRAQKFQKEFNILQLLNNSDVEQTIKTCCLLNLQTKFVDIDQDASISKTYGVYNYKKTGNGNIFVTSKQSYRISNKYYCYENVTLKDFVTVLNYYD